MSGLCSLVASLNRRKNQHQRRRRLSVDTTEVLDKPALDSSLPVHYTTHTALGITVDLPDHMKLVNQNDEVSMNYCNYEITLEDGFVIGEINSLTNGRFEFVDVEDFYDQGQRNTAISISYKVQSDNWFVISGTHNRTGNITYWKRIIGEPYVSDLEFEYPAERRGEVEGYLGRISQSFKSY